MRLPPTPAAAASLLLLLLMLPSSGEAKLGSPRNEEQQHQQLPQNTAGGGPHRPHRQPHRHLSCEEHPGQFIYQTQTNGNVVASCSRLILQVARGVVSASNMNNKCALPLVDLEDRYGPDATVADACPVLCGKPCDGQHAAIEEEEEEDDEEDSPEFEVDAAEYNTEGDVIRFPENDSNEDLILEESDEPQEEQEEVEQLGESDEPNSMADEQEEEELQLEESDEPIGDVQEEEGLQLEESDEPIGDVQEEEELQLEDTGAALIEPNPIAEPAEEQQQVEEQQIKEQPTSMVESPSIIETIQSQIEQELTESEDEEYGDTTPTIDLIADSEDDGNEGEADAEIVRPTPTIATFGKSAYQ
jgi:hypothetical protein